MKADENTILCEFCTYVPECGKPYWIGVVVSLSHLSRN